MTEKELVELVGLLVIQKRALELQVAALQAEIAQLKEVGQASCLSSDSPTG